jgi:hypothetical protein
VNDRAKARLIERSSQPQALMNVRSPMCAGRTGAQLLPTWLRALACPRHDPSCHSRRTSSPHRPSVGVVRPEVGTVAAAAARAAEDSASKQPALRILLEV